MDRQRHLIARVAVMPIAGRFSDVFGRRRTFVAAYLMFLLGSIVIPLSTSFDSAYGWFLVGRILTAIGGGAMVPVALAVVGDVYPEGKRARALGTLGAIETMGWVWGPLYGAMLVHFLSWEWQFWLNIPLALIGLAAAWWALDGHDRPRPDARVDWLGAALLTVTLVSLNVALLGSAEIQSVNGLQELTGEGPELRWLFIVAAVGAIASSFSSAEAHPLVDRRLFRRTVPVALFVNRGRRRACDRDGRCAVVHQLGRIDLDRAAVVVARFAGADGVDGDRPYVGGRITSELGSSHLS
jgi:MFS family permease